jgi:hypothetical protein
MFSQSQSEVSTSATTKSALLDMKIEECAAGLWASVTKQLFSISKDNAAAIVKYIEGYPFGTRTIHSGTDNNSRGRV